MGRTTTSTDEPTDRRGRSTTAGAAPAGVRALAIVPAYNESQTISSVLQDLAAHAPDFDVIVIDDGSVDGTTRIASRHAGVRVVRLPFNLGIGGAMQTGYRFAEQQQYDIAVQVDGDGQHDAREISTLISVLRADESVDMVIGSRFLDDRDGFRSSRSRRAGIRIFSWVLSRIVRERVTDPTSGFRMVRRSGIELFARDYPHDYPEVEALVMMHAHRLKAVETPVTMRERGGGESSITTSRSVYYMAKVLLAISIALLRRRPVPMAAGANPASGGDD
jgi:glycosyltransferase involved in cell wall biosynthesis